MILAFFGDLWWFCSVVYGILVRKMPGDLVYRSSGKDVLGRFLLGTFLRRLFHFAAAVVVAVHVRGILLLYYLIFLILHTADRNDIHAVRPLICILANADNDCHK